MAEKIKAFFDAFESAWDVIPTYVKVFFYSVTSSAFGLWMAGQLDWRSVVIIVATNLGIYQIPRTVGQQTKKLL